MKKNRITSIALVLLAITGITACKQEQKSTIKQYPVQKITIKNGETIAWRQAGDTGPSVLLIHGNMSSSVHWQTTMEQLESEYRVYAPDLRGFGDSTYNAEFDTLRELAQDIEQFVDAIGLDRFAVVGWSLGGGVALELTADLNDRVTSLTLLDSVPLDSLSSRPLMTLRKTHIYVGQAKMRIALEDGDRNTIRRRWNTTVYNLKQPAPADYEILLDATMKQRCLIDSYYAIFMFNMTKTPNGNIEGSGRADLITCPITVMQGGKDVVVLPEEGKSIADYYGGRAEFVLFPEAGHSVITDDLPLFISALRTSLK